MPSCSTDAKPSKESVCMFNPTMPRVRLLMYRGLCLVLQESQLRLQQLDKRIGPAKFHFKPGNFFLQQVNF
jgi:hypothetical protein